MYVNPDTIEAQIQGGTLFGLTAALHGAITFKDGRVEQSNFDSYRPMRINEVPAGGDALVKSARLQVALVKLRQPSVSRLRSTNAIFAATGKRLRSCRSIRIC